MLFKSENYEKEIREHARGGDGHVGFHHIATGDNLPPHMKMVCELHYEKGCSIGPHVHEGEYEIFYVLKGTATITDGDEVYEIGPGNSHIVYPGGLHGVGNKYDEELVMFATIITV